jgi:hypothetical protein
MGRLLDSMPSPAEVQRKFRGAEKFMTPDPPACEQEDTGNRRKATEYPMQTAGGSGHLFVQSIDTV